MSNTLAVATATSVLTRVLGDALAAVAHGAVQDAGVTTVRPDALTDDSRGVNVFLYRVGPGAAWGGTPLPARDPGGAVVNRPEQALTLHYLLTFSGDDAALEPQRLLGVAVSALTARPVLSRATVRAAVQHARDADPTAWEQFSDLAEQVDLVRFSLQPLGLDDMSKLWAMFVQASYRLSVAYDASVVLIDADTPGQAALPVRSVGIGANPVVPPPAVPAVAPAPVVTSATVDDGSLTVEVSPPVTGAAEVLLNGVRSYALAVPPGEPLSVALDGIEPGDYLVRVRTGGRASELGVDDQGRYATPKVTVA